MLREQIGIVHAVLYTHEHADHIFGLDDLRLMQFYLGGPVPLYCEPAVELRIRKSFDYAFQSPERHAHRRHSAARRSQTIGLEPFQVLGADGDAAAAGARADVPVLGFRFGNVAYCTDVNAIPAGEHGPARGLDVLVLDCLRREPHATHFSLDEALAVVDELRPRAARC